MEIYWPPTNRNKSYSTEGDNMWAMYWLWVLQCTKGRKAAVLGTGLWALLFLTSSLHRMKYQPPSTRCLLAFVPEQEEWRFWSSLWLAGWVIIQFSVSAFVPLPLTHPECCSGVPFQELCTKFFFHPYLTLNSACNLYCFPQTFLRLEGSPSRICLTKAKRK